MTKSVSLQSLGRLSALGGGNEAQVSRIESRQDIVVKIYKPNVVNELHLPSLEALLATIEELDTHTRTTLLGRGAFPIELVTDRGKWIGFTMPLLADTFFARHGVKAMPKRVELDWNRLTMSHRWVGNPNIFSEIPIPTERQRLEIALNLSQTVLMLHRAGIIIGDVSGRNLLWALNPTPRAFFLDTDSFRVLQMPGTTTPKETDGWRDPELKGQPTSFLSDLYKLALAISRIFFSSDFGAASVNRPPTSMTDASQQIFDQAKLAITNGQRPDAESWAKLLSRLIHEKNLEGRPVIYRPPPAPPRERQTMWPDRPIIPMPRPPDS
jgi:serine/threonine protein kinase